MVLSNEKTREYMKRLLLSRMRILCSNGFYGLLLMHMIFAIDENCQTAATDGRRIYFGPEFLDEISDSELDFIMMHEVMHVVLQHCLRQGERDNERFNIACDIVVNSNILRSNKMNLKSISLSKYGESMHIAPNGKEGYEYTAEEVYEMLKPKQENGNQADKSNTQNGDNKKQTSIDDKQKSTLDDHSRWGTLNDESLKDTWTKNLIDACEAISIRDPSNKCGMLPLIAERIFKKLKNPQTNWKEVLNNFIQEDFVDYSFTPPDRRFDGGDFFLPDFNEKDDRVEDILFMIDTSGSMSDEMITEVYSEVKGAIDQFDGKLKGWLGFFDAEIVEPKPFSSEKELKLIKPLGGGGTNFQIIFEYVNKFMQDKKPASIVILTDGHATFPNEELSNGIPVLWIVNNEEVNPPWGKVVRIKSGDNISK